MSKPILIIGAGMGGLTLAQGLARNNIPFEIYERDESLDARAQGYRFRMLDTGKGALEHNLPPERYELFEKACCTIAPNRNDGPVLMNARTADSKVRPLNIPQKFQSSWTSTAVDRGALRRVLLDGIEERVHFGKAFKSYEERDGGVTVTFSDGSTAHGTALVGSDGTWSRVRSQLLPEVRFADSEGRLVFGKTDYSDEFMANFNAKIKDRVALYRDTNVSCLLDHMLFDHSARHAPARDYVYWVMFMRKDEGALQGQDPYHMARDQTRDLVRRITDSWHPSLRSLFDHSNPGQEAWFPVVSAVPPIMPGDLGSSRVTLVGDAVHAMSPTSGLGATTALRDAGLLMGLIEQHGSNKLVECFREYEAQMRVYAAEACEDGQVKGVEMFGMRPLNELPLIMERP